MGRSSIIVALVLPLVGLVGTIVKSEVAVRSGAEFRFLIEGYDPRDLLRGQYLQFQVRENWGDEVDSCGEDSECCACLRSSGSKRPPSFHRATCETARAECEHFISIDQLEALRRYYIPEERARELEKRLRKAAREEAAVIVVSVSKNGRASIKDLLIDDVSISDL